MPDNKNIDYTNNNEIKIFLASSINEFEKERNKIGDLVRRMQDELLEKGIRINLFECEFEDNAMVKGRKQEQYNQKLRESDIMILLIGNRAGQFTVEEYEVSKEVKYIKRFIFFKNCEVDESAIKFREKLGADVYEGGFKNKIKEYDEEEKLYNEIKAIISDSVGTINTNNLEKEKVKKYNFIFLEGNKDLGNDKYAISNFIRNINDKYQKYHVYFNFITNDDISSLTEKDMKDCSGFFIIVGKDIDEKIYKDFDMAYKYFIENESPDLRPFVKKDIKERTKKADEFIKYLGENLQHYYGEYIDIYRIKYEINNKIDDMKTSNASVEIIDGSICIDGEEIISLDKIPMYSNNEQLVELKEEFEKIEDEYLKLKSSDKTTLTQEEKNKLDEITEKYYKYKRDIQNLENQIFNFSKKFSKEAGKNKLTKKQIAAYKCLEKGDLDSAKEILNIEDINNDIAHVEAEQESGRKKLAEFVQELISRAETYDLDVNNPDRVKEIYSSYERAIKVEKDNNLDRNTSLIFADFCMKQSDYNKATELLQNYINWAEYTHIPIALELYIKLTKAYALSCNFEKGRETVNKLYVIYENNYKDDDITKCRIDVAYADIVYSEWKDALKNGNKKVKTNINDALSKYLYVILTLNDEKYGNNDVVAYQIIKSEYGILNYCMERVRFNKIVNNYFYGIKSWYDNYTFSTQFEDLQEIKIDIYYKYANNQFNKINSSENDYSELVGIYNELINYTKEHLHEKPKLYNLVMFDSYNKLEEIYTKYGLHDKLISLYDDKIDVISNKVVIMPDNKNTIDEIANLKNRRNQAIKNNEKLAEKYKELSIELKNKYYEEAENNLKENNFKKTIIKYKEAISYIQNNKDLANDNIYGSAINYYFYNDIYNHIAKAESKNNKYRDAIKNYKKCLEYQAIFKKIGFNKYNLGDYELYQYKILQEMIKTNQIKDAIKLRDTALKDIGIEISKNLTSDELIRIGKDFADEKISNALSVKKQNISEFVPNKKPGYFGEIQAKFVDLAEDALVGYAVNLYDFEDNNLGQSFVGSDAKISYYKVPVGMYRIALVDKYKDDKELMSKYVYVNGADVSNFKLVYPRDQIRITLVDDANTPLQGGTFNIYDGDGNYLAEVTTDENGKACVTLRHGYLFNYYFKLVHIIGNYTMDETLYKVTIDNENRTFCPVIKVERHKGRFAIQVKDKNSKPVEGLKMRIYNSDKDEIVTITTNKNGQAGAKNLPLGKYYYKFIDQDEMNEFIIKEKDEIVIKDVIK